MKILENISLKPFNTFGIDKKAAFFTTVSSIEELKDALSWANDHNLPVLILGGGSNILLTQEVKGLVIKIEILGIQIIKETENEVFVEVGAGQSWHEWVQISIANNWAGIENLSLIPGTVGASPMQNIGAYGVELKDVFQSLKALNKKSLEVIDFSFDECEFGYRESVFKHQLKDQFVITSVTFRLQKQPKLNLDYGTIRVTLKEMGIHNPGIKEVSNAVIQIRKSKLPDPVEIGNAGSFFKNPTIDSTTFEKLLKRFPTLPNYPNENGIKIPAGWLIEQAGWKGKKIGNVGVHEKQALVLVNYGNGSGEEIKSLAQQIQNDILQKFGIDLHTEVNFI